MKGINEQKLSELLSAYLDGELEPGEAAQVERILAENPSARRQLEEFHRTAEALGGLPRHPAPPSIVEDWRIHAERDALLGDAEGLDRPLSESPSTRFARFSYAAIFALLVVSGVWYFSDRNHTSLDTRPNVVAMAPGTKEGNRLSEKPLAGQSPLASAGESLAARRSARDRIAEKATPSSAGTFVRKNGKARRRLQSDRHVKGKQTGETTSPQRGGDSAASGLVAMAGAEQKLAAGIAETDLRAHRFSNETVRLRVTVVDASERDAVTSKIVSQWKAQRLTNLAFPKASDAPRSPRGGGFFYRGKAGVNFQDSKQRQLLVRVPVRDLYHLVETITKAKVRDEDLTLVAGPVVIHGANAMCRQLGLLGASMSENAAVPLDTLALREDSVSPVPPRREFAKGGKDARRPEGSSSGLIAGLWEIFRIPPTMLPGITSEENDISDRKEGREQVLTAATDKAHSHQDSLKGSSPASSSVEVHSRKIDGSSTKANVRIKKAHSLVEGRYEKARRIAEKRRFSGDETPSSPASPLAQAKQAASDGQVPVRGEQRSGEQPYPALTDEKNERFVTLVVQILVEEPSPSREAAHDRTSLIKAKNSDRKEQPPRKKPPEKKRRSRPVHY